MTAITLNDIATALAPFAGQIKVLDQKVFIKLAVDGKALYIKKTKSGKVGRLDISGFRVEHDAVVPPKKKNGKVTGQVLFADSELAAEAIDLALVGLTDGLEGTKTEATAQ